MSDTTNIGRNEPCPCGSSKKYKRCCGVNAAPKITPPKPVAPGAAGFGGTGMDPSQMDQQQMMQVAQALQRLPRGQMQRLQAIIQKAMAGKDVTQEAEEFEKTLPVEFQDMLRGFKMPGSVAGASAPTEDVSTGGEMTEEQARELVAKAASEGKLSTEEAETLLKSGPASNSGEKNSSLSRFWRGITGKN